MSFIVTVLPEDERFTTLGSDGQLKFWVVNSDGIVVQVAESNALKHQLENEDAYLLKETKRR